MAEKYTLVFILKIYNGLKIIKYFNYKNLIYDLL